MSLNLGSDFPWIVFVLDGQRYALSSEHVREMTTFTQTTKVPHAADFVRGVINIRGEVMSLVDLRMWVGLQSALLDAEQLIEEMHQREQEHRDWVGDLEDSIRDKRPFTKTTDPHACKFGKWYDNYHTNNPVFRDVLRRFNRPHNTIHQVAIQAISVDQNGDSEKAMAIIEETRNTVLVEMINLFGEFRDVLKKEMREIAIVLDMNGCRCGVVVDSVVSVERLKDTFDSAESLYHDGESQRIPWIGRRLKDDSPVLLPDFELMFSHLSSGAARMDEAVHEVE